MDFDLANEYRKDKTIFLFMEKKERIHYNTTLDVKLLKKLKFLSIEENKRHNELLEEAIELLLKKYENKSK